MTDAQRGVRRSWTPAVVLLIGLFSILLLFWIARLGERQRDNFLAVDALDDLHIHVATFHIRLEEHLSDNIANALAPAWERWDRAARLLDAIQYGGLDDHNEPILPLKREEYLAKARQMGLAMSALRETAALRVRGSRMGGTDPAVERRFHEGFQAITRDIEHLENRLEADSLADIVSSRRLIRAVCAAWVLIVLVSSLGIARSEGRRRRSEEELRAAHDVVLAQTGELKRHEQQLAEVVEVRTAELSRANQELHTEIAERRSAEDVLRKTEAQIRVLSSRLLQAQEFERKRIAMELHDELGQALSVMKLQIRIVERGLDEGQAGAKDACEKLLDYIDHVIADVRRLSMNLSPTVLEDLGLTSALRWLITGIEQDPGVQVTSEIAPIDDVFPGHVRIVVYRVIQEALTNVAKHARASHVAVTIRREGGEVTFLIEDDGIGFDVARRLEDGRPDSGFGLRTMKERVRMIGGRLDLSSREGAGTRISFSVPDGTGGH